MKYAPRDLVGGITMLNLLQIYVVADELCQFWMLHAMKLYGGLDLRRWFSSVIMGDEIHGRLSHLHP